MTLKQRRRHGELMSQLEGMRNNAYLWPPEDYAPGNNEEEDEKYQKYFKMLKVGMPMPAVQHAMTRDGLDPAVMDGDHNKPAPDPAAASSPAAPRSGSTAKA